MYLLLILRSSDVLFWKGLKTRVITLADQLLTSFVRTPAEIHTLVHFEPLNRGCVVSFQKVLRWGGFSSGPQLKCGERIEHEHRDEATVVIVMCDYLRSDQR
jgi:hypothetical protein